MSDITVDSTELKDNAHPDYYRSTLSGNTGYKLIVVIKPSEKEKLSKTNNRPGSHKEPK